MKPAHPLPPRQPQHGAALIIGLILLLVASIVASTSMRGSVFQERMTANLNNQAVSFMAAEAGASAFWQWLSGPTFDPDSDWDSDNWQSIFPTVVDDGTAIGVFGAYHVDGANGVAWLSDAVEVTVIGVARLAADQPLSQTRLLARFSRTSAPGETPGGGTNPFGSAIIGCEGVTTKGSGRIDSYDSRVAPYNPNNPGNKASVSTTEAGAQVLLEGNAPIYGDVHSTGGVRATGSSPIHGNVTASGDVEVAGGGVNFHGDVTTAGSVIFGSSGTVHGDISANGNVAFNNWGAEAKGDVQAGGNITSSNNQKPPQNHIGGNMLSGAYPGNTGVATQPCDPLGIADEMAQHNGVASTGPLTVGQWPRNKWEISPTEARYYDETWNVKDWVTDATRPLQQANVLGESTAMLKLDSLNLTSVGELRITGGDVVLFVDGNIDIGGNTKIIIEDGSTLTILTTGKFDLAGSVVVNDGHPVNSDGKLPFSLYSAFEQNTAAGNQDGIKVRGNTDIAASIYAPGSHVSFSGSGDLFGQVRGKTVTASGAGAIHYDEALGDSGPGGGGGGSGTPAGPPVFGISDWRVTLS